jgi:8-oxo-dGTP pyrophosphatase MutT (NUDIX family)
MRIVTGQRTAPWPSRMTRVRRWPNRESHLPAVTDVEESMETNIAWSSPENSFKLRAAAFVRDADHLLICAVEDLDGWFLPGGKVQFGESSATALARELTEEFGVECAVGQPALIAESVRGEGQTVHQEVCFYYEVAWPADVPRDIVHVNAAERHSFAWVRIEELTGMTFMPREIVGHLIGHEAGPRYAFFDRRSAAEVGHRAGG